MITSELCGLVIVTLMLGAWTLFTWLAPRQLQRFQVRAMEWLPNWWPMRDFNRSLYNTDFHIRLQRILATVIFLLTLGAVILMVYRLFL